MLSLGDWIVIVAVATFVGLGYLAGAVALAFAVLEVL